ncbi:hypothetical protein GGR88_002089 [Sphingomonas jejuensis]|uniref:DUF2490 domain-containing protein n=1 Tax=Sphingomonas jejuensis TaxID=904715 RepID=A0ABX0XMV7_9SPHN|nr:DUF2490 domain-containing protein [Sphingomonas jejuensis]NJC34575.1 hypothetical protein [Sphingomonas jejuensis]
MMLPVPAAASTDEQLWLNVTVQGPVAGPVVYFAEIQPRFGDGISTLDQRLLRGAAGLRLSDAVSVHQGYARVVTPQPTGPADREDRSFQQVSWSMGSIGRGRLSSRFRLEQRWRSDGRDTGWRARGQLRFAHPLDAGEAPVSALGWVEGFFHLNDTDWGTRTGFDRVRSFAGVELPMSGRSTIEAGYLNQVVRSGGDTTMQHVAALTLMLRR